MNIITALKKDRYLYFLIILAIIGAFLRLVNFSSFVTFLGDQGRDAIIFERIMTFKHFPAIGAPSSVGQVYLGPFYYYLVAPWLLLTKFDPVGPALGNAVFSILYILVNYFTVKWLINTRVAFLSSTLITFSITMIEFSRFAWNPNLLPLFSLLSIYFLVQSLRTGKMINYVLFGGLLALTIQLHYLALLLFPTIVIYLFTHIRKLKDKHQLIRNLSVSLLVFLLFSSPLIIFDLRHEFLNVKNLISLFSEGGHITGNVITNFFSSFNYLNLYVLNLNLPLIVSTFMLLVIIITYAICRKQSGHLNLIFSVLLVYLLGIAFYNGPKNVHYFGAAYSFYFIILAYYLSLLTGKRMIFAVLIIVSFIFLNGQKYYFLNAKGPDQIKNAKAVALVIKNNNFHKKFRLASLPERSSESPYRYFLEIWGTSPVEHDSLEKTEVLFITCEQKCLTIGNPLWEVAYFAPNKVVNTWKVNNVTIYKLSH